MLVRRSSPSQIVRKRAHRASCELDIMTTVSITKLHQQQDIVTNSSMNKFSRLVCAFLAAPNPKVFAITSSRQVPAASCSQVSSLSMSSSSGDDSNSFYSLSGIRSDGSTISMADMKGKVVYATNVASQ